MVSNSIFFLLFTTPVLWSASFSAILAIQVLTLPTVELLVRFNSSRCLPLNTRTISSANPKICVQYMIHAVHNIGPNTEPRGTPGVTAWLSAFVRVMWKQSILKVVRYEFHQISVSSYADREAAQSADVKGFLTSRVMMAQYSLLPSSGQRWWPLSHGYNRMHCINLGDKSSLSNIISSLLHIIFFRSLPTASIIQSGREPFASCALLAFGMRTNLCLFRILGNVLSCLALSPSILHQIPDRLLQAFNKILLPFCAFRGRCTT